MIERFHSERDELACMALAALIGVAVYVLLVNRLDVAEIDRRIAEVGEA